MGKRLTISPLTPYLGAEISGINLSAVLAASGHQGVADEIRQAFTDYHVLFFREQLLDPAEVVAFSRWFGHVGSYPFAKALDDHPEVIAIIKEPDQTSVFGGIWHTDTAYMAKPSLASVLYAIEVPELGGDTLFANMHTAYEMLDSGMQQALSSLNAVHSSAKNQHRLRADHLKSGAMVEKKSEIKTAIHPVVRHHPVTQRASLYLSPAHTTHFEGQTAEESDVLLQQLFNHCLVDDFKCRFRWSPRTLAIWDNRCLLHYPVNDYHGKRREMWRVTIDGDVPR